MAEALEDILGNRISELLVRKMYRIRRKVRDSVRTYLRNADPSLETSKDFKGMEVDTSMLRVNYSVCNARGIS